jgi:hypothetical protein
LEIVLPEVIITPVDLPLENRTLIAAAFRFFRDTAAAQGCVSFEQSVVFAGAYGRLVGY